MSNLSEVKLDSSETLPGYDTDLRNIYDSDWSDSKARAQLASNLRSPKPQTVGNSMANVKLSQMTSLEEEESVSSAIYVSWVSVIACLFLGLASIWVGVSDRGLALVGLGMEILLDAQSSVIVLWRFKKPKERCFGEAIDAAVFKSNRDTLRENRANFFLSIVFLVSAAFVSFSAVYKLVSYDPELVQNVEYGKRTAKFEEAYSFPMALFFIILAFCKWSIAKDLQSQVLKFDAMASAMGGFMALVVGFAGILDDVDGIWIADPIAALCIALLMLVTGCFLLAGTGGLAKHQRFRDTPPVKQ